MDGVGELSKTETGYDTRIDAKLAKKLKKRFLKPLPESIRIKRACSRKDFINALRFVYDCYDNEGIGDFDDSERFMKRRNRSQYFRYPNSTFIAKDGGKIVGTLSSIYSFIPAVSRYNDEIRELDGGKVCEFSNWACDSDYGNESIQPNLMGACFADAMRNDFQYILGEISKRHVPFFENNLFEKIGDEKEYSDKEKVVLISLDLKGLEERAVETDLERGEEAVYLHKFWFSENPYLGNPILDKWDGGALKIYPSLAVYGMIERDFAYNGQDVNEDFRKKQVRDVSDFARRCREKGVRLEDFANLNLEGLR